jgi:hypothetical protein
MPVDGWSETSPDDEDDDDEDDGGVGPGAVWATV